jgi:kinesin family protein 2/24
VRRTGSNGVNERSSRSHAVVQFVLRAESTAAEGATLGATLGKITLVDLAGSERAADTMEARSGDARVHAEGAAINQSLLSLKECIRAMEKGAHHVPFRGSKLTQVL